MFGSLLKAVVGTVVNTPIAVAKDVGGVTTDKKEPYTAEALKNLER